MYLQMLHKGPDPNSSGWTVWKIINENLTEMESGSSTRGAPTPYHSPSIVNPTGRDGPCWWLQLYYPSKKTAYPFPTIAQPMIGSHNSAKEEPPYFECPVYSNGLFPLSSVKEHSSPLFHVDLLWFYCSLLVPNCNSLLLLNIPIFCW